MHLAIYDMDRTITIRGTFTPFLLFAARRRAPWRLVALPLWLLAMACHKAGLIARKPLKQYGIRLLVGRTIPAGTAHDLAARYAAHVMARNVQPGALAAITQDRVKGRMLVMATAAPDFYARTIGAALGFDAVIATRHAAAADGGVSHRIVGENCYGAHKLVMIRDWLAATGHAPHTVRFYSDDLSDAPTLDWADVAFVVNPDARLSQAAALRGWQTLVFR
ncbi:HAD family hydrolase [Sphingobium algorifonticola]|uniref:HAD-IB family hydrolase n=1 Tax=Sphingobium algorifonticola TaxID=2008318 RepID=A0A437JBZ0_9SPHN|nr:HAD-IB family phosphatase [Sphingobium algorifonticola]RVT43384.1 HAD-IB family hydrolase [Sphingobium algorifonticola]